MNLTQACSAAAVLAGVIHAGPTALIAAQQVGKANNPTAAMEAVQGFNIVLLVGESGASGPSLEEVPAAARKALADMREFLPFKTYRVLDSHWTSCCVIPLRSPLAGRLQGLIAAGGESSGPIRLLPRTFGYMLQVAPSGSKMSVRFSLTLDEPTSSRSSQGSGEISRETRLADVRAEMETLALQIRNLQARVEVGTASSLDLRALQDKYASLERRNNDLAAAGLTSGGPLRAVIDSSFMMEAGETVVVGTSRLGGDKALIALVTAARKGSAGR